MKDRKKQTRDATNENKAAVARVIYLFKIFRTVYCTKRNRNIIQRQAVDGSTADRLSDDIIQGIVVGEREDSITI